MKRTKFRVRREKRIILMGILADTRPAIPCWETVPTMSTKYDIREVFGSFEADLKIMNTENFKMTRIAVKVINEAIQTLSSNGVKKFPPPVAPLSCGVMR